MTSDAPSRVDPLLSAPRARRPASRIAGVLGFALGFAGAISLVQTALGALPAWTSEEEGVARIKARHLAEHGSDYDTLFVGSSQVYRQIDVALFDRELAREGIRTRSYNLGLPGMRFFETLARLAELLEAESSPWRTLVIELQDADPDLRPENERSRRDLGWHTPAVTWIACRTVWDSPRSLLEKLALVRRHLLEGALHVTSQGEGLPAALALLDRVRAPEDGTPGGFLPLELDPSPGTVERRREFLEELTRNRAWLDERWRDLCASDALPTEADLPSPAAQEALRNLVTNARARGVEPVFVLLPPSDRRRREMLAARERGILPNLIDLESPESYPEFHRQLSLRYDEHHLNQAGAARLTSLLARSFRELPGGDS